MLLRLMRENKKDYIKVGESKVIIGLQVKIMCSLRCTKRQYKNSQGDARYSIGNIVNNTVITTYGVKWVLDFLGSSFLKLYKCLTTILYSLK